MTGITLARKNVAGGAGDTRTISAFFSQDTLSTVSETLDATTLGVRFIGGRGDDMMDGGDGIDVAEYSANQDIGFVNAGQSAEIKLETFSYTKYGTVNGTVDNVTADAVTDEKRGSYYPATLTLAQRDMLIDGKRVPLSPGMNVTAEIKTGKRRIIEFLLSPVQRAGSESLRER